LTSMSQDLDFSHPHPRSSLAQRWAALDNPIKMTLRVSILAALLVNAATGWAFHEFGGATGVAGAPAPAMSPAAPYAGQAATGNPPTWRSFAEWP
jgi:hypothetical protein